MTKVKVRNKWSTERLVTQLDNSEGAKQEFKDECDINVIINRYKKTGNIYHLNQSEPAYGVAEPVTYHEALNLVMAAQEQFEQLPSQARKRFNNNPTEFMEYIHSNPDKKELFEMGLLDPSIQIPAESPEITTQESSE